MIEETHFHIGYLIVSVHLPNAQSLKDKRQVIKSLKTKAHQQFNVSAAELDALDKWQFGVLGFTMICNDKKYIEGSMQSLLSFIETFGPLEICEHELQFC